MKCLSLREPWAWLILRPDLPVDQRPGVAKDVENRAWGCPPQGRIALHASKTFDSHGYRWVCENMPKVALFLPEPEDFQLGGIVGTVEHRGCVTESTSRWFFGPVGHVLSDPRPCVFRPWAGRLGFFEIPDSVVVYP